VSLILGTGAHRYESTPAWGELPSNVVMGEVAGVAVDSRDHVYAFNRGSHPVIIFDDAGNFAASWGEDFFIRPHAIEIGHDGFVYCADEGRHTVTKHTLDGELVLEIGTSPEPSPFHSGRPFNRCTHTALSPEGDIYVSDGYGNARIHKFSPDGKLLMSWGSAGMGEGAFNLPHNIVCSPDGVVYVADRENHRIQVFSADGEFLDKWDDLHRPSALHLTGGPDPVFVVGELGPVMRFNRGAPNLGPRLSIVDSAGQILARLNVAPAAGAGPGQFVSPHGIATDSRGDIYVGEVANTGWPQLFPDEPTPDGLRFLKKLIRVSGDE
jgi:hypothetical protein